MTKLACFLLSVSAVSAEVRTLTLKQVADLALQQNADIALARLDQQKARDGVKIAKDAFSPKLYAGSGLAWTTGFPGSIEGSAPSIIQVRTVMSLYNRPQSYQVAQANEAVRSAEIDVLSRQDEVVYRAASLYLDAEAFARGRRSALLQVTSLERVRDTMAQRVAAGQELPVESKKANLAVLKAQQRATVMELEGDQAEMQLAILLGFGATDRVRPAAEERTLLPAAPDEEEAVKTALENSRELRKLESGAHAKNLELKGHKAARWPKVDLVAQYALFGKYNNYEDYFQRFSRHNAQIGASITLPILPGLAPGALAAQTEADLIKLKTEMTRTRNRISADTHKLYQDVKRAEAARDVARADLDVAREQLSIALAQFEEGRLLAAKLEDSRVLESEKWIAYYDAQHGVEHARLALLRHTGQLMAALK